MRNPPAVNVLLLEGTRMGESRADSRGAANEREVEEQALAVCRHLPPADDIALELIETRTFGSRVIYERYRRARAES